MSGRPTQQQIRRFRRACASLNRLMDELLVDNPQSGYYLANDNLHLMVGESHDASGFPLQSNSVACCNLRRASGGDW
jgi:hypothetical protein